MTNDEALAVLLKLVSGNKDQCFKLVESVREAYPGKSMQWCIQKAIYDIRFPPKAVKPNPTLNRWGEGGGNFSTSSKSTAQPVKRLPPPPPPNPVLSTPKPQRWGIAGVTINSSNPLTSAPPSVPSPADLKALVKAKQQTATSQPASGSTKQKLYRLTGNHEVGDRLVRRIKLANPHRSEQWAYEKAIYDLERDRI